MKKQLLVFLLILTTFLTSAQLTTTIGPTTGSGSTNYGPIVRLSSSSTLRGSAHSYIYNPTELGIPNGSIITKLEWLKHSGGTCIGYNNFETYLKNTNTTTFTPMSFNANIVSSTLVFSDDSVLFSTPTNGWFSVNINPFTYTGANLQLTTKWYAPNNSTDLIRFYRYPCPNRAIGTASTIPVTPGQMMVFSNYGNYRPTLRITYQLPTPCGSLQIDSIVGNKTTCPYVANTLSLSNSLPGTVTYDWESSTDSVNFTYAQSGSSIIVTPSANSYYRCISKCGVNSDTTPVFSLLIKPNYECFGISTAISNADEDIAKFTLNNISNISGCTIGDHKYTNYQYLNPILVEKNKPTNYSITVETCLNDYPNMVAMFIDYNHDGVFNSNEQVVQSTTPNLGNNIVNGNIIIPTTATEGITKLRVIASETTNPITSGYGYYSFGETEDYLIYILPETVCQLPKPGYTIATDTLVCKGGSVTFSLENLITGTGATYQWFKFNSPVYGATTKQFTNAITDTSFYYCQVVCGTDTAYSDPLVVHTKPFYECYCNSSATNDADVDIFSFQIDDSVHHSSCPTVSSIYSNAGKYENIDYVFTTLTKGLFVNFIAELDDCDGSPYYSSGFAIWIDYNQDGVYTNDEKVYSEPSPTLNPRFVGGSFTVPTTALSGKTGMRLIVAEGISGPNLNSCSWFSSGETENYFINIVD